MAENRLIYIANGGYIEIELLDTPVAKIWKNVFRDYLSHIQNNNLSKELIVSNRPEILHYSGAELGSQNLKDIVDECNMHIDNVNSAIKGRQYPWRAYEGMHWRHTNTMHRGFTTGKLSLSRWEPYFTHQERIEIKKLGYEKHASELFNKTYPKPSEFEVIDHDKFITGVHGINHCIHVYEGWHGNKRASLIADKGLVNHHLFIEWNQYDPVTHRHAYNFNKRVTYDDLVASVDINNFYEFDVFVGKSITGKSYGVAYSEYDDPLEYDVTNLEAVAGTVQIYQDKDKLRELFTNSPFSHWLQEAELEPAMYLPIPIGKIKTKSIPLQFEDDLENETRYTDGSKKKKPPYDSLQPILI